MEQLFGVKVKEPLFDDSYPSLGISGHHSPAYLCLAGIKRMAEEFLKFPKQYEVNVRALKAANNPLSGVLRAGLCALRRLARLIPHCVRDCGASIPCPN